MTIKPKLNVETLELREVPAILPTLTSGGDLSLRADAAGGTVRLYEHTLWNGVNWQVTMTIRDEFGSRDMTFARSNLRSVTFTGGSGRDVFDNDTGIPCTATGNGGVNILKGGSANDTLTGGNDTDVIYGRGGNDTLSGGGGIDTIYGDSTVDDGTVTPGNDTIHGGGENDTLYGDFIIARGRGGRDTIHGDGGNDTLFGGDELDQLFGGTGDDDLYRSGRE